MKIKNWAKFQHFKDRSPPWVKLYRDILDDPDWHTLDGSTAKVLVSLWLIASEDENRSGALPDVRKMAFRLRTTEAKLNQELTKLSHYLIQDDISEISERYQDDAPETETETETETENHPVIPLSPEADTICSLLRSSIVERDSKAKVPKEFFADSGWGMEARLLLEKDGRTQEECLSVLRWAVNDSFWKSNILSIGKFREKFTTLKLQATEAKKKSKPKESFI